GVSAPVLVDVEAHLGEAVEDLFLAPCAAGRIERLDERVKPAPRRDAWVQLPDRAGGGIAWVGERRLALAFELLVQALKTSLGHVDLTADFEGLRELSRNRHRERDAGNRLDVGRDVFADITVTPRSEEHTSELQSQSNLVCRLLLE